MKDEDDSVDGAEEEADEQAEELSDDESSPTEDASDEVAEAAQSGRVVSRMRLGSRVVVRCRRPDPSL